MLDDTPYTFSSQELTRLAIYRTAVLARFYNENGIPQSMTNEFRKLFGLTPIDEPVPEPCHQVNHMGDQ